MTTNVNQPVGRTGAETLRVKICPVCQGITFTAKFQVNRIPIEVCDGCGLLLQNPQPSDAELAEIYDATYFIGASEQDPLASQFEIVKRATARLQLQEIDAYLAKLGRSPLAARLIEIGCGHGNMLLEAQSRGYEVSGIEISTDAAGRANARLGRDAVQIGALDGVERPENSYDVCVLADVIEHVRDPKEIINRVFKLLRPSGIVYIATPSMDSWSAKLMGRSWMEYKREHLFYFNPATITKLLSDAGFTNVKIAPGSKILTPKYIIGHFEKFPVPVVSPILGVAKSILPKSLLERELAITASGINVLASKPDGTGKHLSERA